MTFVQHLETIGIATANPDMVELGFDERWVLPEHAGQVVGTMFSDPNGLGLGPAGSRIAGKGC